MNRYQITLEELKYLHDMVEFLKDQGNSCSEQGSNQLKEVFDRISSRPVFEQIIDPKVFAEHADFMAGTDIRNKEKGKEND